MKKIFQSFIRCGILGWCLEIIFTALHSLRRRDFTLKGTTSLWMFPIYGAGCLLYPLSVLLRKKSPLIRGMVYAVLILGAEYITGSFLRRRKICPWDYGQARWNIGRVIRPDYLPCWMVTGLLMEQVCGCTGRSASSQAPVAPRG